MPVLPSNSEPLLKRVVERMLGAYAQYWGKPTVIEGGRDLCLVQSTATAIDASDLVERRWWHFRQRVRNQKSPNPLESALAEFLWLFHKGGRFAADRWGRLELMSDLAAHMRSAARAVQMFGRRLRTGEAIQDNWQRRVCEERAAFLRALQRAALLPRADTRAYFQEEFRRMFWLVAHNDWGSLPFIEMPDVPRLPWWQRVLHIVRTTVVAILPLGALYLLSDQLKTINATVSGTLWSAAVVWLAVSLLTLLDERFSEKFSAAKEVLGTFGFGKSKE